MVFTPFAIIGLLFPAIMFAGGAYIFYRGFSANVGGSIISGRASSQSPLKSWFTSKDCVYCKVTVESPAPDNWHVVHTFDARTKFMIGKVPINPDRAVFELSDKTVFTGRASTRFRGLVAKAKNALKQVALFDILNNNYRKFLDMLARRQRYARGPTSTAIAILSYLVNIGRKDESNEIIDDAVISKLLSSPKGKELEKYMGKELRITEYVAPIGAKLFASGASAGEIVVSDEPNLADSSLNERNFARVVIGAGLMFLSLAAFFYILVI